MKLHVFNVTIIKWAFSVLIQTSGKNLSLFFYVSRYSLKIVLKYFLLRSICHLKIDVLLLIVLILVNIFNCNNIP